MSNDSPKGGWKKGQSGNPGGRPKNPNGSLQSLREGIKHLLPVAIEKLEEAIRNGDPLSIKLFCSIYAPPQKPTYPPVEIDIYGLPPREVLEKVIAAVSSGSISVDHASAILDLLAKTNRMKTALALVDAPIIADTPLETAQAVMAVAVQTGDLETVLTTAKSSLPYTAPRPQSEPPEPSATISIEPYELTENDWAEKHGATPRANH